MGRLAKGKPEHGCRRMREDGDTGQKKVAGAGPQRTNMVECDPRQ